jgi:hypothetical protein
MFNEEFTAGLSVPCNPMGWIVSRPPFDILGIKPKAFQDALCTFETFANPLPAKRLGPR